MDGIAGSRPNNHPIVCLWATSADKDVLRGTNASTVAHFDTWLAVRQLHMAAGNRTLVGIACLTPQSQRTLRRPAWAYTRSR